MRIQLLALSTLSQKTTWTWQSCGDPQAAFAAQHASVALDIVPVSPQIDRPYLPFAFDIAIGVRRGDTTFRAKLDDIITQEKPSIDSILQAYNVPRLDFATRRRVAAGSSNGGVKMMCSHSHSQRVSYSLMTLTSICFVVSCKREARDIGGPLPPRADSAQIVTSGAAQLGKHAIAHVAANTVQATASNASADPYSKNAYGTAEGKRLYSWMNCIGCHANGGGAIGPPLMDSLWIYGSAPADIYYTIEHGRPNGMPEFGARLNSQQIWQLVAYVRSLSGITPKWARPGRDDHMQVKPSEQQTGHPESRNDHHANNAIAFRINYGIAGSTCDC